MTEKPTVKFPTLRWAGLLTCIAGLACITGTATGCAAYRTVDLSTRAAHTYPGLSEQDGIAVSARAFLDAETAARYFGNDLWDSGAFPIIVHVENRGSASFELHRARFRLSTGLARSENDSASPLDLATALQRCKRAESAGLALAPLLVFPAVLAYHSIDAYNGDRSQDWAEKSLPAHLRLEPRDAPIRGAIFFERPEGDRSLADQLENAELRVSIQVEGSRIVEPGTSAEVGKTIEIVIPLSGATE